MKATPNQKTFNSTAAGQKAMFYKASRISVLLAMNQAIRRICVNESWNNELISNLPDSQIDAMLEAIRQTYNRVISAYTGDPLMPNGWSAWFNPGLVGPTTYGRIVVDALRRGGQVNFNVFKSEGDPTSSLLPARRRAALFAHLVESGLPWDYAKSEVLSQIPEPTNEYVPSP